MLHKKQFLPPPDTKAYRIFAERVAHTNYERRWRHTYKGPGFKAHLLAILVFIVPKIGAASDLAIKIPTHETEEWYLSSMNRTVDQFREILHNLLTEKNPATRLANLDLDTGERVRLGDYALADKTYTRTAGTTHLEAPARGPPDLKRELARLLRRLSCDHGDQRPQDRTIGSIEGHGQQASGRWWVVRVGEESQ